MSAKAEVTSGTQTYSSKFWLWPTSMQVQIINDQTRSSVIMFLSYDPLKQYLKSYEVEHLGKDPVLEQFKGPSDFKNIRSFIDIRSVQHIALHGPRFGDTDESFVNRSIFGYANTRNSIRSVFMDYKEMDVYLIKVLVHRLFKNPDTYKNAVDVTTPLTCKRYLN